jgi:hypothetical protein
MYARSQDPVLFVAFPIFLPLMVDYRYEMRVSFSGTTLLLIFIKIDKPVDDDRAVMPYHLIVASDNVKIYIIDADCYLSLASVSSLFGLYSYRI